jgi:hypothetical protein
VLWPIVVVVAGFLAAYAPVGFGWPDLPWFLPEVVIGAGLVWLWLVARTRPRRIAAGGFTLVAALHAFWMFSLSAYEAPAAAPQEGQLAPDVETVRVRDGATFTLSAQRGQDVLLVFFRGAW